MKIAVEEINTATVLDYVQKQPTTGVPIWEKVVLDQQTIIPMLTNGSYAKHRKSYGLFIENSMCGYAVVYGPEQTLDLMHVAQGVRGNGLSKHLLNELNVTNCVVDENNLVAINLYTKLGYDIELIKE